MKSTSMRLWAGLFVLLVFVAGVAGGVTVRPWIVSGPAPAPEFGLRNPRGAAGDPRERLLDRIAANIELTAGQDRELRAAFDASRQRMRGISADVSEQFDAERTQLNAEIADILTPEQLETFDNEIMRVRRERRSRGERGNSRDPGFRGPRRGPDQPDR